VPSDRIDLIRRLADSLSGGDVDALVAATTEDVVFLPARSAMEGATSVTTDYAASSPTTTRASSCSHSGSTSCMRPATRSSRSAPCASAAAG
jgi:hypothetical protein